MSDTYFCPSCDQEFDDRQTYLRGLIFDGQSVSKGATSTDENSCCHRKQ